MAEKRRFLDVWIVEGNTVYREVPFMVVTDWIQQGRLLGDDKLRPSGTAEWFTIGTSPAYSAYMPKVEEHRAEDQAEALESVQIDFTWKRPEDEDDDVDMIPLIDISLVLLIFFMMTATIGADIFQINTPKARNSFVEIKDDMKLWVGIDPKAPEGTAGPRANRDRPWYSLGLGSDVLVQPTNDFAAFVKQIDKPIGDELNKLVEELKKKSGISDVGKIDAKVKVRIRADYSLRVEKIKNASAELKNLEYRLKQKGFSKVEVVIVGDVSKPQ